MIASWMLYTLAMSVLLTVMAVGVERIGITLHRQVRFIWVASMSASLLVPPAVAMWRALAREAQPVQLMPFVIDVQRAAPVIITADGSSGAARLDWFLASAWIIGTAILVIRLGLATRSLHRRRMAWRRSEVDGVDVHLAPDAGPAVIGIRSMSVVLPEWIFDLDKPLRAMVLRHEEEHRAARDPYLLFGAAVAVALMPWNLALWFQARRLRLAIELDCDARVLRTHPRPERYGLLLLTIAQRRSLVPSMLAPMLSEPASHLERRIVAMRNTRFVRLSVLAGAGLAVLALGFACTVRSPDSVTGPHQSAQRATAPVRVYDSTTFREFQVEQEVSPAPNNPSPRYPDSLRAANVEGEVVAQFVVDTMGRADMTSFKVLKETHPMFTSAVRSALPQMKFNAAEVGGRKVKQLLQMPFQFSLHKTAGTAGAPFRPQPKGAQGGPNRLATVVTTAVGEPKPGQAPLTTTPGSSAPTSGARPRPGNRAPRYPDAMRVAGIEGEVIAQFVVNADGTPDMGSFKVIKATDAAFVDAVKSALPEARFYPAEVDGRPVRALTQMPFAFTLTKP
jgi:TonB family protein